VAGEGGLAALTEEDNTALQRCCRIWICCAFVVLLGEVRWPVAWGCLPKWAILRHLVPAVEFDACCAQGFTNRCGLYEVVRLIHKAAASL
jgi:hypothetical protein